MGRVGRGRAKRGNKEEDIIAVMSCWQNSIKFLKHAYRCGITVIGEAGAVAAGVAATVAVAVVEI